MIKFLSTQSTTIDCLQGKHLRTHYSLTLRCLRTESNSEGHATIYGHKFITKMGQTSQNSFRLNLSDIVVMAFDSIYEARRILPRFRTDVYKICSIAFDRVLRSALI